MASAREKVAYLKGLMNGYNFQINDGNARAAWEGLIGALEELVNSIDELGQKIEDQQSYIEAIDSDLEEVECAVFGDYEEEEEAGEEGEEEREEDYDDGSDMVEMECPNCHEMVAFEEGFLGEPNIEVSCPRCDHVVYTTLPRSNGELTNGRKHQRIRAKEGSQDTRSDS